MSFTFNRPQRSVLPQVAEALQQLHDDPQQLASERDRRYNRNPPPYAETTQPPTPASPVVDPFYEHQQKMLALYKSLPWKQFESQVKRETERLEHQRAHERFGRRQTLPWDDSSNDRANAENNVRSRWVEQGI
ncbi:hypothetical protein QQS21_002016 [Conoideocrella luteorostrata]|uniref:Uncharacterized protein n=1 Tax=Conoideocrella luteorostrata TaxID=1105319 RepID=A0AAJ0G1G7_9HYPO|nr:hypothetical protein QQS21_002016 [Conoideocrella luteorostrata]